jgi:hypothetical protein
MVMFSVERKQVVEGAERFERVRATRMKAGVDCIEYVNGPEW